MIKKYRSKLKFLISTALALAMLPVMPMLTVNAEESFEIKTVINSEKAVSAVVSDNVKTSNIDGFGNLTGQMGIFNNGVENVGMENGLVISTGKASNIAGVEKCGSDEIHYHSESDKELETLADYKIYDKAYLEFTMENTQSFDAILTFNYAFGSTEFDQPAEYNDCFGLFVDYNLDGKYDENIAKLPNGKIVTIQNIKKGHYYTGSAGNVYKDSFNGMSNVFTALTTKTIKPGGRIRLKIAIADISDNIYNSAVFIQGKSVSIGKKIEPPFISGENFPNGILNSEFEDKETTCTYQWYITDKEGTEGTPLVGETGDKLKNITEKMVGKYVYLKVDGTGDYTGTANSNYLIIEDFPYIQEKFSYYTTFHYTEPYRLTTFGKGEDLTAYYYVSDKAIAPTPKEMLKMGTAVECTKTMVINGVTYSGADCKENLYTKDIGKHIYVMFGKKTDKAFIHSGVKDRQLLQLFNNAKSLGFTEKEANACGKIVELYNALMKIPEDTGNEPMSVDFDNSSIKDYKSVSLSEDFSKDIKLSYSRTFGWKITGTVPYATGNYGVVLYNCNKNNLTDLGYSRKNLPSGEELLKIKGLEVYSLKDNNIKVNETEFTAFNNEVTPSEMDTDFIFALWHQDSEGNIKIEKSCYKNVLDMAIDQAEKGKQDDKNVLSAMTQVFEAVKTLCS